MSLPPVLQERRVVNQSVYDLVHRLGAGDTLCLEFQYRQNHREDEQKTLTIVDKETVEVTYPHWDAYDVYCDDRNGETWRIRSVEPAEDYDGQQQPGSSQIYRENEWALNTAIVASVESAHGDTDG